MDEKILKILQEALREKLELLELMVLNFEETEDLYASNQSKLQELSVFLNTFPKDTDLKLLFNEEKLSLLQCTKIQFIETFKEATEKNEALILRIKEGPELNEKLAAHQQDIKLLRNSLKELPTSIDCLSFLEQAKAIQQTQLELMEPAKKHYRTLGARNRVQKALIKLQQTIDGSIKNLFREKSDSIEALFTEENQYRAELYATRKQKLDETTTFLRQLPDQSCFEMLTRKDTPYLKCKTELSTKLEEAQELLQNAAEFSELQERISKLRKNCFCLTLQLGLIQTSRNSQSTSI